MKMKDVWEGRFGLRECRCVAFQLPNLFVAKSKDFAEQGIAIKQISNSVDEFADIIEKHTDAIVHILLAKNRTNLIKLEGTLVPMKKAADSIVQGEDALAKVIDLAAKGETLNRAAAKLCAWEICAPPLDWPCNPFTWDEGKQKYTEAARLINGAKTELDGTLSEFQLAKQKLDYAKGVILQVTEDAEAWAKSMAKFGTLGLQIVDKIAETGKLTFSSAKSMEECGAWLTKYVCPQGQFQNRTGGCEGCPAGRYGSSENLVGYEQCSTCPSGHYSAQVGLYNRSQCVPCAAGKSSGKEGAESENACEPCGAGYHQAKRGQMSCNACAPGTYSNITGLSVSAGCFACPRGRFSNANALTTKELCNKCPPGHYSDQQGQTARGGCTACAPGKSNALEGSDLSNDCVDCDAGRYQHERGKVACNACVPGKYGNQTGQIDSSLACQDCDAGRFSNTPGANAKRQCTRCPPGTAGGTAGAASSDSCNLCAPGLYQDEFGKPKCKPCASGTSSDVGAFRCGDCLPGEFQQKNSSICEACPEGKFSSKAGSGECYLCPAGTEPEQSRVGCVPCPPGKVQGSDTLSFCLSCSEGSRSNDARTGCLACEAGQYQDQPEQDQCIKCPRGTWSSARNATSESTCKLLPPGVISSLEGLTSPEGFAIERCPAGTRGKSVCGASGNMDLTCEQCPEGRFQPAEGQEDCEPCGAAFTSSTGQKSCRFKPIAAVMLVVILSVVLGVVVYYGRRRARYRRKYAIVTIGKRRCGGLCCCCGGGGIWSMDFPRRSQFSHRDIDEGAKLGNGAFGEVKQGTLQVGEAALPIAVKHVLASKATNEQRQGMIVECRLQCEMDYPFLVKCFGFSSKPHTKDFSVLLELMDLGDLPTYVTRVVSKNNGRIPEATRVQWMIEIAAALEYMHNFDLIHADVAARNLCMCLQKDRVVCKLADFGMSRRVSSTGYDDTRCFPLPKGSPVPMWWSAPECLPVQANFVDGATVYGASDSSEVLLLTPANDVWSFGVTMWEVELLVATGKYARPYADQISKGDLALVYNKLRTKQAKLDFNKFQSATADKAATFRDPGEIALACCLRVRPWERASMTTIRHRLQNSTLCQAPEWSQDDVHEWFYRMGVPRAAEDSDLLSLGSFADLCSELLNDKYRPDYLDPRIHPDFTLALSSRIVDELKALQVLDEFKGSDDWPQGMYDKDAASSFDWLKRYQDQMTYTSRRWIRVRLVGRRTSLLDSRARTTNRALSVNSIPDELRDIYTSGSEVWSDPSQQKHGAGEYDNEGKASDFPTTLLSPDQARMQSVELSAITQAAGGDSMVSPAVTDVPRAARVFKCLNPVAAAEANRTSASSTDAAENVRRGLLQEGQKAQTDEWTVHVDDKSGARYRHHTSSGTSEWINEDESKQ